MDRGRGGKYFATVHGMSEYRLEARSTWRHLLFPDKPGCSSVMQPCKAVIPDSGAPISDRAACCWLHVGGIPPTCALANSWLLVSDFQYWAVRGRGIVARIGPEGIFASVTVVAGGEVDAELCFACLVDQGTASRIQHTG